MAILGAWMVGLGVACLVVVGFFVAVAIAFLFDERAPRAPGGILEILGALGIVLCAAGMVNVLRSAFARPGDYE